MVKKYIILANTSFGFETPRQLIEINGEPLIARTIRLLKENGIKDIIISSNNNKFDNLNVKRYTPIYNDYNPIDPKSPWLKAFPIELNTEPVVYLFGDVYYSENAIKTIIKEDNKDILFFCTYNNECPLYIKHHDEPLAFKVYDFKKIEFHINRLIDMWNNDETVRRPIAWELYRSINNQDVNVHKLTTNYVIINDESCDIDTIDDIMRLRIRLGGEKMIKVQALENFSLERFDELQNIQRAGADTKGRLNKNDIFECKKDLADYLLGDNPLKRPVVKVIEIVPKEKVEYLSESEKLIEDGTLEHPYETIMPKPIEEKPKTTKKKKTTKK